ncbi:unnamed protein product [Amoebophrya sp. A25]|nr:unnamed protein product [Amoebophrya sp. A25]|eukprot:GSA25T00005089001.1
MRRKILPFVIDYACRIIYKRGAAGLGWMAALGTLVERLAQNSAQLGQLGRPATKRAQRDRPSHKTPCMRAVDWCAVSQTLVEIEGKRRWTSRHSASDGEKVPHNSRLRLAASFVGGLA